MTIEKNNPQKNRLLSGSSRFLGEAIAGMYRQDWMPLCQSYKNYQILSGNPEKMHVLLKP
jgi:hypothetical protein